MAEELLHFAKYAENPEALGKGELDYWKEVAPIINDLLDELKANGKIETSFTKSEIEHMTHVMDNLYRLGKNSNLLINLFKPNKNFEGFLEVASRFGFDESSLALLYIETSVLSGIFHLELFKNLLLFHLKDVDPKVNFYRTMEKNAPKTWQRLKPIVDNKFRNSLAHGSWALENKHIVLFEDAELIPFEKLNLGEFIIRVKKVNILYTCFLHVLMDKMKQGLLK